jgi:hypothetical protein
MNLKTISWHSALLSRFQDREHLGAHGVCVSCWPDLGEQSVLEVLTLIQREYGLEAGLLRPDDALDKLLKPIVTRSPFKWLVYQLRASDKQSELNLQLRRRMDRCGTRNAWSRIETIDDLVRAWCGQQPTRKS